MIRGESNFDDKYVEKVFNWSEFHLSEMTCYKIHTLRPTIMGRLFEKFGMEPSLSYNQYRLISAPGEPQKLELASQVEIQKLRIQVEQTNVLSFFRFFFNFTTVFTMIYLTLIFLLE